MCDLDTTKAPRVINGLSVDSVNRRLFYADSANKEIASVAMDGSNFKMLVAAGDNSHLESVIAVPSSR